ncbi:HAD-IIB family hydrolase [Thalassovita sp.]|uniref:HAD-IIB family hydrolase n=1 Tax=Thalassovita sp. TaxID=1979401 RepID=UPI002880DC79|nr:HAD-IIB family hydrolase [Thalassovita sp.]MDF1801745.1 HAD-IIB family hydrolase [Thalassovita sp.]
MRKIPAIVFTDLDGTLLDHHSYSYAAAVPALTLLKKHQIPVIMASSKTAAEIAPLRQELGLAAYPAIVENGAGLLPAQANAQTTDRPEYQKIRDILQSLPQEIVQYYKGFGDMSNVEVSTSTGLSPAQSALAKTRAFSEPGLWKGPDEILDVFLLALSDKGITARQGGRYLTLSFGKTKADQMASLCELYGNPPVIALGDAPNDVEMLLAADHPVLICNPDSKPLPGLSSDQKARITHSTLPGPQGWNEAIMQIVPTLTCPEQGT